MVGDVHRGEGEEQPRSLAALLERSQEQILSRWASRARQAPSAQGLSEPLLRDHLPAMLESLARCLHAPEPGASLEDLPYVHATERLDEGFDLEEVAREYAILREEIVRTWRGATRRPLDPDDALVLNRVIDHAISLSVSSYARSRERTLRALDNVTSAALAGPDLELVLDRLIAALKESAPVIDSAALLLIEEDELVVRAAVGAAQEHAVGMRVPKDDGLAGLVVAREAPVLSRDARRDPRLESGTLRKDRLGSAYGVPLVVDDEVAGVAVVGSETAQAFSREDLVLIRAMAARASSLLALVRVQRDRQRALEVVERGDACFLLDAEWRIVLVNAQQEVLSQKPRSETLGRCFWDVWPETKDALYWSEYHRARDAKELVHFEEYFAPLDLWTDVTAFPTAEGGIGVLFRDATSRKRSERALKGSEERFRLLADLSRSLAEHGADLQASLQTTTAKLAEHLGDLCTIRLLTKDQAGLQAVAASTRDPALAWYVRSLKEQEPIYIGEGPWGEALLRGESLNLPRIGPEVIDPWRNALAPIRRQLLEEHAPKSMLLVPLRVRGKVLGVLSLARVRSEEPYGFEEQSLAEEVADRAGLAIENARLVEQLQDAVRTRDEIVAIVGHDLRNPLSAVTMSAELMQRRPVEDERHQRGVDRILTSSRRANRMIRDLLDFTQARVQGIPVKPQPASFHDVICAVVDELRAGTPDRHIELEIRGDGAGTWDPDRLAQVVSNLVGNALHHSPPGSPVRVESAGDEAGVTLRVHNGGEPIPDEVKATMFQPFRRRGSKREGLGLGLYISARIVEAHGGQIALESTKERGTTFTVTLPRHPPAERSGTASSS